MNIVSSSGGVSNSDDDNFTTNTSENITPIVDGKEYKYYSNSYYSLSYYGSRLGKTGYKITWTDTSGTPIPEETIPSDSKTQYKYYGTSVPISYTVHFDATGCTGTAPADIACTFDVEFTMPKNELTVTGKKAFGWYTKSSTTSYELIATYSVKINEATTFTANWVQVGSLKFNVTLPTTSEDDIQLDYTSSTNLLTASLTGFSGTYNWYINGNTTTVSTGSTFSLLTNYSKLSSGMNSVMVTATSGSKTYSATVFVKKN